jgi:protein-disulfide isomerase
MEKTNTARIIKKQRRQMETAQTRKTQRLMVWTLAILFIGIVSLIIMNVISGPQGGKTVDVKEFQYDKHPSMGSKDAPVKVVEFADFKCPACKEFDQTILSQLKKDFVDNGTVQLYFINYPIISPNADSRTAAMAGEAVYHQNPEEFWKFYEAVYAHQGDERTNWATSDVLVQIAKQSNLKVDYAKLKKDIDDNTFAQDVKDDEAIADKLGVNSTPTIFINGKEISDNDTFNYSAIKEAILKSKGETDK